jgi:catechol 2,3-dioxygenase-like lactoylglutathione lyase family enzyme
MARMTTAAAPALAGIHHITLPVADLDVAERFYVGLLGLPLERRFDRATFLRFVPDRAAEADAANSPLHLQLRCGAVELDLFLQRDHVPGPVRPHPHLAFAVAPEHLDVLRARLLDAGVPVDGPRRLGPPGHASVYFDDPFGNLLEFTTSGYPREIPFGPPELAALRHGSRTADV